MSCFNSKIVDAPLAKVWSAMRDFHQLDWATGVVETCEKLAIWPGTRSAPDAASMACSKRPCRG